MLPLGDRRVSGRSRSTFVASLGPFIVGVSLPDHPKVRRTPSSVGFVSRDRNQNGFLDWRPGSLRGRSTGRTTARLEGDRCRESPCPIGLRTRLCHPPNPYTRRGQSRCGPDRRPTYVQGGRSQRAVSRDGATGLPVRSQGPRRLGCTSPLTTHVPVQPCLSPLLLHQNYWAESASSR